MPFKKRPVLISALLGGLVLVAAGAWYASRPTDIFAQCRDSRMASLGQIGGPFTLVSETGETVTDVDVFTRPSLVYFGYTYCPDVCPLDNARNAEATDILESHGILVNPVFISIDPVRDTPELLAEFTDIMHPRMLGLTGTPAQVLAASKAYHTYFRVQDPNDPYTLIDHSTMTYLVFPKIGYVDYFDRNATAQEMADRVACYVDAWEGAQSDGKAGSTN